MARVLWQSLFFCFSRLGLQGGQLTRISNFRTGYQRLPYYLRHSRNRPASTIYGYNRESLGFVWNPRLGSKTGATGPHIDRTALRLIQPKLMQLNAPTRRKDQPNVR